MLIKTNIQGSRKIPEVTEGAILKQCQQGVDMGNWLRL